MKILDIGEEPEEEEGGNRDLDAARKGKCAVIKTSTRQVRVSIDFMTQMVPVGHEEGDFSMGNTNHSVISAL